MFSNNIRSKQGINRSFLLQNMLKKEPIFILLFFPAIANKKPFYPRTTYRGNIWKIIINLYVTYRCVCCWAKNQTTFHSNQNEQRYVVLCLVFFFFKKKKNTFFNEFNIRNDTMLIFDLVVGYLVLLRYCTLFMYI